MRAFYFFAAFNFLLLLTRPAFAEEIPPLSKEDRVRIQSAEKMYHESEVRFWASPSASELQEFTKAFATLPEHPETELIRDRFRLQFLSRGIQLLKRELMDADAFLALARRTIGGHALENTPEFRTQVRLNRIVLPKVKFVNTPLREALDKMEGWSREFDPEGQGVRFRERVTPYRPIGLSAGMGATEITLILSDVPLLEALRYTLSLAQVRFIFEGDEISIEPISSSSSDLPIAFVNAPAIFSLTHHPDPEKILTDLGFLRGWSGDEVSFHSEQNRIFAKCRNAPSISEWIETLGRCSRLEELWYEALLLDDLADRVCREFTFRQESLDVRAAYLYRTIHQFYPGFHPEFIQAALDRVDGKIADEQML